MGAEPGSVYGQTGTMKDVLARCLKKTNVQVCTLPNVYMYCSVMQHSCACIMTGVFFCRLKINHEPHEFILDSGTVANNN